jgi:hypothetical protein
MNYRIRQDDRVAVGQKLGLMVEIPFVFTPTRSELQIQRCFQVMETLATIAGVS